MRRSAATLVLLASLVGLPPPAGAQAIAVTGGDVDLYVPFGPGGFGAASDQSTGLTWVGDRDDKSKITVETLIASQAFWLTVEALAPHQSDSAGPVALTAGMLPRDLVVNIKKARGANAAPGSARLRYEASVPAGSPPPSGADVHTVLFTLTQQ